MKKTISCILAVLMLCTMMPTVFAEVAACSQCGNIIDMRCDVCGDVYYCTKCEKCDSCGYTTPDHTMVVQYGMAESYLVTVPAAIVMDESGYGELEVSVANAMLASGQSLSVYIDGDSFSDGYWHLTDSANVQNRLMYTIEHEKTRFQPEDIIIKVDAGEVWNAEKSVILALYLEEEPDAAGVYSDILTFMVDYEKSVVVNSELSGTYMWMGMPNYDEVALDTNQTLYDPELLYNTEFIELLSEYFVPVSSIPMTIETYEWVDASILAVTPWLKINVAVDGDITTAYVTYIKYTLLMDETVQYEPVLMLPELEDVNPANVPAVYLFTVHNPSGVHANVQMAFAQSNYKLSEHTNLDINLLQYRLDFDDLINGNGFGIGGGSLFIAGCTWQDYLHSKWDSLSYFTSNEMNWELKDGYVYNTTNHAYLTYESTGERVQATDTLVSSTVDVYNMEVVWDFIEFNVDGNTYTSIRGLTWGEWLNSSLYDGSTYTFYYEYETGKVHTYHYDRVIAHIDDVIIPGHTY